MTRILAVSDEELSFIFQLVQNDESNNFDFIISCGDLPFSYLENLISLTNKDLYYVRGNHARTKTGEHKDHQNEPQGAIDLHLKTKRSANKLLLAGIEGSLNYNNGPFQYTRLEFWWMVVKLVPQLILNFLRD